MAGRSGIGGVMPTPQGQAAALAMNAAAAPPASARPPPPPPPPAQPLEVPTDPYADFPVQSDLSVRWARFVDPADEAAYSAFRWRQARWAIRLAIVALLCFALAVSVDYERVDYGSMPLLILLLVLARFIPLLALGGLTWQNPRDAVRWWSVGAAAVGVLFAFSIMLHQLVCREETLTFVRPTVSDQCRLYLASRQMPWLPVALVPLIPLVLATGFFCRWRDVAIGGTVSFLLFIGLVQAPTSAQYLATTLLLFAVSVLLPTVFVFMWETSLRVSFKREVAVRRKLTSVVSSSLSTLVHGQQQQHFAELLKRTTSMMTEVSGDGIIHWVSPASRAFTGLEPDEVVRTDWLRSVHPEDQLIVRERLRALAAVGTAVATSTPPTTRGSQFAAGPSGTFSSTAMSELAPQLHSRLLFRRKRERDTGWFEADCYAVIRRPHMIPGVPVPVEAGETTILIIERDATFDTTRSNFVGPIAGSGAQGKHPPVGPGGVSSSVASQVSGLQSASGVSSTTATSASLAGPVGSGMVGDTLAVSGPSTVVGNGTRGSLPGSGTVSPAGFAGISAPQQLLVPYDPYHERALFTAIAMLHAPVATLAAAVAAALQLCGRLSVTTSKTTEATVTSSADRNVGVSAGAVSSPSSITGAAGDAAGGGHVVVIVDTADGSQHQQQQGGGQLPGMPLTTTMSSDDRTGLSGGLRLPPLALPSPGASGLLSSSAAAAGGHAGGGVSGVNGHLSPSSTTEELQGLLRGAGGALRRMHLAVEEALAVSRTRCQHMPVLADRGPDVRAMVDVAVAAARRRAAWLRLPVRIRVILDASLPGSDGSHGRQGSGQAVALSSLRVDAAKVAALLELALAGALSVARRGEIVLSVGIVSGADALGEGASTGTGGSGVAGSAATTTLAGAVPLATQPAPSAALEAQSDAASVAASSQGRSRRGTTTAARAAAVAAAARAGVIISRHSTYARSVTHAQPFSVAGASVSTMGGGGGGGAPASVALAPGVVDTTAVAMGADGAARSLPVTVSASAPASAYASALPAGVAAGASQSGTQASPQPQPLPEDAMLRIAVYFEAASVGGVDGVAEALAADTLTTDSLFSPAAPVVLPALLAGGEKEAASGAAATTSAASRAQLASLLGVGELLPSGRTPPHAPLGGNGTGSSNGGRSSSASASSSSAAVSASASGRLQVPSSAEATAVAERRALSPALLLPLLRHITLCMTGVITAGMGYAPGAPTSATAQAHADGAAAAAAASGSAANGGVGVGGLAVLSVPSAAAAAGAPGPSSSSSSAAATTVTTAPSPTGSDVPLDRDAAILVVDIPADAAGRAVYPGPAAAEPTAARTLATAAPIDAVPMPGGVPLAAVLVPPLPQLAVQAGQMEVSPAVSPPLPGLAGAGSALDRGSPARAAPGAAVSPAGAASASAAAAAAAAAAQARPGAAAGVSAAAAGAPGYAAELATSPLQGAGGRGGVAPAGGAAAAAGAAGAPRAAAEAPPSAGAPAGAAAAPPQAAAPAPPTAGMHILFVDDESVNRRLGERMLRRLGCTSVLLEDGDQVEAALAEARQRGQQFDAVLLDIYMQRTDGGVVCQELRAKGVTLPIIAMTGTTVARDVHRFADAGFDLVLPKPFDIHQMGRAIIEGRARRERANRVVAQRALAAAGGGGAVGVTGASAAAVAAAAAASAASTAAAAAARVSQAAASSTSTPAGPSAGSQAPATTAPGSPAYARGPEDVHSQSPARTGMPATAPDPDSGPDIAAPAPSATAGALQQPMAAWGVPS